MFQTCQPFLFTGALVLVMGRYGIKDGQSRKMWCEVCSVCGAAITIWYHCGVGIRQNRRAQSCNSQKVG